MRVLITGATGFIGGAVREAALARDWRVRALARSPASAEALEASGCEVVRGDLREPAAIAAATRGVDGVVHAAALNGVRAAERVELDIVGAMVDSLAGSGRPFVYTSSSGLYGDTGPTPVDERHPVAVHPATHWGAWTPSSEAAVRAGAARDVAGVVVRPPLVYGRGGSDALGGMLSLARRLRVALLLGSGTNRWSTVHVDDLADLYLRLLADPRPGATYNAADGADPSLRQVTAAIAANAGTRRVARIPTRAARLLLRGFVQAATQNNLIDATAARRDLGWSPQRPTLVEDLRTGSYAGAPSA